MLSQALAPYKQNEQQMALMAALQAIGLPMDALKAIQSTMRPDQLAMMLKGILPGGGGSGGGSLDPATMRQILLAGGGPQTTPSILPDQLPGLTAPTGDTLGAGGGTA